MRFSKYLILLAVAGCESMTNPPLTKDLSTRDFNIVTEDLAGDVDMTSSGDMKAPGGCTQLATWPKNLPVAYFDPAANVTAVAYADAMAQPFKALVAEDWHLAATETYPKAHTFTSADKYNTCEVCSTILDCTAANGCTTRFFAQAGTVSISKADKDELVGRMTATGTNLKLVEWDVMTDTAVTNGACYEVASMTWDVPWDNRPDMGAASGDMTAVVTDMALPDLAGVDLGGCHPLINEVLTGLAGSVSAEFVEIYNPCGNSFTTTGWKIVYRSAAGNTDLTVATLPASIAAGEYLVYVSNQYVTAAGEPDAGMGETGRTLQPLAAAGGGLALKNGTTTIDSMGWGTATNAYVKMMSAPAPTPTAFPGTSIARRTNAPIDTGNNRNDFVADTTPTPKAAN